MTAPKPTARKPATPAARYPTVAEIRATVDAAKRDAEARAFAATGCTTAREFFTRYLAPAIQGSTSPADAMRQALAAAQKDR